MTNKQLKATLSNGLFASRSTLTEAYEYAMDIARSLDGELAVMTAIHVLMNTIANQLEVTE